MGSAEEGDFIAAVTRPLRADDAAVLTSSWDGDDADAPEPGALAPSITPTPLSSLDDVKLPYDELAAANDPVPLRWDSADDVEAALGEPCAGIHREARGNLSNVGEVRRWEGEEERE